MGLYGRRPSAALAKFDSAGAALWWSFAVAVGFLPIDIASGLMAFKLESPIEPWALTTMLGFGLLYVGAWTLWPLLSVGFAHLFGRADRARLFVVAQNWAILPMAALSLRHGDIGEGWFAAGFAVLVLVVTCYVFVIARAALAISTRQAVVVAAGYVAFGTVAGFGEMLVMGAGWRD